MDNTPDRWRPRRDGRRRQAPDPPFEGEDWLRRADLLVVRLRSILRLLVSTFVGNVVLAALAGTAFAFVMQGGDAVRVATRPVAAAFSRPAEPAPSRVLRRVPETTFQSSRPTAGATSAQNAPPGVRVRTAAGPVGLAPAPATAVADAPISPTLDNLTPGGSLQPVGAPATEQPSGSQPPPPASPADGSTTTTTPPPPPPVEIADVRAVSVTPFAATVAWRTSEPVSARVVYGVDAPTLWSAPAAPSVDHVATVTGLTFGMSYKLWVEAHAPDGRTAVAPFVLTTPGLPAQVATSTGGGAFLVDDQPFFPTFVWNACPDSYARHFAAGIDLFMGNGCGSAKQQLERLGGRALSLVHAHGPALSGGPGYAGTFLPDEWDLHLPATLSSEEGERIARATSPGPRFLTLTNHFYSRAEALPQGRAFYPVLAKNAEVLGFDLYPLQSWCRYDSFGDVFEAQRELVVLARGKPTFQWIEARTMDCPGDQRLAPTPETVRAETWLAIAAGANAIGYFPEEWSPEIGDEIAREKREILGLVPALVTAPLEAGSASGVVRVGAREHNGALYVIAVNPTRAPVSDTVVVPALGARTLRSYDGTRSVAASGGAFADTFEPLEVRIYVAPPAF